MKYARMGDTGLVVSRISFGAMTFTLGNKAMEKIYKVGEDLAREMVAVAIDKGVNFFDTADGYASGESEITISVSTSSFMRPPDICDFARLTTSPANLSMGL